VYQEYLKTNAEILKEQGLDPKDFKVEKILRKRAEELNAK